MSALTDNFSVITSQNRSRANSKYSRQYQKVSQLNLDHKSIISYLKSHRFSKTLAIFTSQSQYAQHIQPIIEILNNDSMSFEGNIHDLIARIKKQAEGKVLSSPQKLLTIEFMTFIWYCLGNKELNKSRLSLLKDYIDKNGQILAQIPSLLTYFALPYFQQPINHPLFKRLFTKEWKQQLIGMICQIFVQQNSEKVELEWLNIIKDLIEICSSFYQLIPAENKKKFIQTGFQRVKQYKTVIESNKVLQEANNDLKQPFNQQKEEKLNFSKIKNVKSKLIQLNKELQEYGRSNSGLQISIIYHKLQLELVLQSKQNKDKQFCKQLIKEDILLLNSNLESTFDRENLKLLQFLMSYYQGRNYLENHLNLLAKLKDIISLNFKQKNSQEYNEQVIYICLDILQKAVIRKQVFQYVLAQKGFVELLLKLHSSQKADYLKGSKKVQLGLTANTALLMQIIMHRKGRYLLASTLLFQDLIELVQKMKSRSGDQVLQKAICSCIYLLLVEPHIRARAQKENLKDKLLGRMMVRTNKDYETIVGYIIERMSVEGEIEEEDSDEDVQKAVEYDQTIIIKLDEIWHRSQLFNLNQRRQNKIQQRKQVKKVGTVETKSKEKTAKDLKKAYSKDKYSWKKKE